MTYLSWCQQTSASCQSDLSNLQDVRAGKYTGVTINNETFITTYNFERFNYNIFFSIKNKNLKFHETENASKSLKQFRTKIRLIWCTTSWTDMIRAIWYFLILTLLSLAIKYDLWIRHPTLKGTLSNPSCKQDYAWLTTVLYKPLTVHWVKRAFCRNILKTIWIALKCGVLYVLSDPNTADALMRYFTLKTVKKIWRKIFVFC